MSGSVSERTFRRPDVEAPLAVWEYAFALERWVISGEKRIEEAVAALTRCVAAAGNPDAAEGCRQVIRIARDILDDEEFYAATARKAAKPDA